MSPAARAVAAPVAQYASPPARQFFASAHLLAVKCTTCQRMFCALRTSNTVPVLTCLLHCRGAFPSSVFLEVYIDGGFVTGENSTRRVSLLPGAHVSECFCPIMTLPSRIQCVGRQGHHVAFATLVHTSVGQCHSPTLLLHLPLQLRRLTGLSSPPQAAQQPTPCQQVSVAPKAAGRPVLHRTCPAECAFEDINTAGIPAQQCTLHLIAASHVCTLSKPHMCSHLAQHRSLHAALASIRRLLWVQVAPWLRPVCRARC